MSDPAQQSPTPPEPTAPAAEPAASEQPPSWVPPGAAPFGPPAPAAPVPLPPGFAAPSGGYAPPTGYAPPPGYAAPVTSAPTYAVPTPGAPGYAAAPPPGYAAPPPGVPGHAAASPAAPGYPAPYGRSGQAPAYGVAPVTAPRGRGLGFAALMLALAAAVGTSLLAAIAAFAVGVAEPRAIDYLSTDFDWSLLTPVRGWVLVVDIAFWVGTILGVWAIVQGIIAAVARRGRGTGITAIVVAAAGPVVFMLVAVFGLVLGATSSGLA